MTLVDGAGAGLAEPNNRPSPPYRVEQVYAVNTADSPPTLTVGAGDQTRPMPFIGATAGYQPGDTVAWVERNGSPLVIGVIPRKGSGDPLDADDSELEAWHVVGAAGEPAFQNSWVNWGAPFASAGYYRDVNYWVRLQGVVRTGTDNTTIFTLPADYRPPFACHFSVSSNNTIAYLRVGTDGTVRKVTGGSNIYVSLDGVTFPVAANPAGWGVPALNTGWVYDGSLTNPAPLIYVRDDGWCWARGSLNGSAANEAASLPEDARPFEYSEMISTKGPVAVGRLDLQYRGNIFNSSGTTGTFILGGANWWGVRAQGLPFVTMTLLNGWVPHDSNSFVAPAYYRDHLGIVHLRGLANQDARTSVNLANLPAGYRPAANHAFQTITGAGGGTVGRLDVGSNGNLTHAAGSATGYFNLTGVSFRAEQ